MHGLTEIIEANKRATDVAFLRARIEKALGYLERDRDTEDNVLGARLVLAAALEGRTIEEEEDYDDNNSGC